MNLMLICLLVVGPLTAIPCSLWANYVHKDNEHHASYLAGLMSCIISGVLGMIIGGIGAYQLCPNCRLIAYGWSVVLSGILSSFFGTWAGVIFPLLDRPR